MKCSAIDPSTGDHIEVSFNSVVQTVDHPIGAARPSVYIAPAWIDLQVNGYAGADYNSPATAPEAILRSVQVLHSTGTGRFYPTVITGSPVDMAACLANLARAKQSLGEEASSIEGFHVEGPHISPDDGPRGAHPLRWVRKPDLDEYRRWQEVTEGAIRVITLSPEWPGTSAYIERLVEEGVVVSVGHTKATTEQIQDAVRAGATMSTHLGNGAHAVLSRHPNYIWDQLAEDRLTASFILDGIHLGEAFLKVALRAKTPARSVLVTDASAPAGSKPGFYRLGEQEVELTADGRVVLKGQARLAGSALRMDRALEILMRQTGIPLAEALATANRNPARAGRVGGRLRGITPGERADFVLFEHDTGIKSIRVVETIVSGRTVFR